MAVPLVDLAARHAELAEEVEQAVLEVLRSGKYVLGETVAEFEKKVAAYAGVGDAVGVASGTDALLLALMVFRIGEGDAVITSPFTFFATAGSVARTGARPVFVDIDEETFNIDPRQVAEFLETRCDRHPSGKGAIDRETGATVRAIMPVHLFGQTADMDPLLDLAGDYGLWLIEDAAQALGAVYGGKKGPRNAGAIGEMACLSFFPTKNLGGVGDGGMILTDDPEAAERSRMLRDHGARKQYLHGEVGINSRLDALQAAALAVKLDRLDAWNQARIENADRYEILFNEADLGDRVKVPRVVRGNRHVFHQYTVRASQRDRLRAHLLDNGIGCGIYYPMPLHLQECFADLGYAAGSLPIAEKAAGEVLSLPIAPEIARNQQVEVVDRIREFYLEA